MFDKLTTTITLPVARSSAAEIQDTIGWRFAAPLIGSASIGLWMLVGKALAFLIA